jgi:hypothetical protein
MSCGSKLAGQVNAPSTGLADADTGAGQVLSQTLVVLRQAAELQLGHGLLGLVRNGECRGDKRPTLWGREFMAGRRRLSAC